MIREANRNDLNEILRLYLYLHETSIPEESEQLQNIWDNIINDENHHLIICEEDGKMVASCVCVIIPNLTRNVRPYAFIENVVTHPDYRKKGYATACLNYAKQIAEKNNCYKMMLLTGSKKESTLNFYRNAGYNSKNAILKDIENGYVSILKMDGKIVATGCFVENHITRAYEIMEKVFCKGIVC